MIQTDAQLRFVTANAEFTLFHEMGHPLIAELQLPVLGREEDAADQLGLIGLYLRNNETKDRAFYRKLVDIAEYWRLEWQRPKPAYEEVQPWDSHALDAQRFYNIACLIYGSDPDNLDWVLETTEMPAERALYCDQEFAQARHAVEWFEANEQGTPPSPHQLPDYPWSAVFLDHSVAPRLRRLFGMRPNQPLPLELTCDNLSILRDLTLCSDNILFTWECWINRGGRHAGLVNFGALLQPALPAKDLHIECAIVQLAGRTLSPPAQRLVDLILAQAGMTSVSTAASAL